jgi:hypothetical protein
MPKDSVLVAVGGSFVAVAQSRPLTDDVGAKYQVRGGDVGLRFGAPGHHIGNR